MAMTSGAFTTVKQYLAKLPAERRRIISAVREVIMANLDADYEEGPQYGGIGYYVPHRVYPPGYHCDPKQPLPFAGLAWCKNNCSFYIGCLYNNTKEREWFEAAWAKTGKRLKMGKACIWFKTVDDLALDVIGKAIKRMPAKKFVKQYEDARREYAEAKALQKKNRQGAKRKTSRPKSTLA